MPIWLVRAGARGEYEQKFIQEGQFYVTWGNLDTDLSSLSARSDLESAMERAYPDAKHKTILNWVSQVWPFAHEIREGDLVALPLKSQPAVQFGVIKGNYRFEPKGPNPFFHWRQVEWESAPVPRSHFGKDLLFSFGAFMTICRIQRNDAELRIFAMRANGWSPEGRIPATSRPGTGAMDEGEQGTDLEQVARDRVAQLISTRFKGHDLSRLVEAILMVQGYVTFSSPEGPDGGVDILGGSGPLGFDRPRVCVQVKSGDGPVDRPTVDSLMGALKRFGADEGLFVSWGGFRNNVKRELARNFFSLRLWTQDDLLDQLFAHYGQFNGELKAELPLKQIWTVVGQDEDE